MQPTHEEIIINDKEISTEQWTEYVMNHPEGTIRHLPEWKEILEEAFGYEPYYLFALRGSEIEGILPLFKIKSALTKNRLSSVPFSSTCGPIADSSEVSAELITKAKMLLKELDCEYLELRTTKKDFQPDLGLAVNEYYVTYILELSEDTEKVWRKLDKGSVRWAINKSKREGVIIEKASSIDDIKAFNKLNQKNKKNIGVPSHPFIFLENIWEKLIKRDYASLYLAKYDGNIIAGIITMNFKDTMSYAYGASDKKFLNLRPNNLILWTAIEEGCRNHYKYFDFGRTPLDNIGLINFKKRWGTEERKLYYYYFPTKPKTLTENREGLKYKLGTKIIRRMPMPIYKKFSDLVFKHLG
ncbi:MAG: lipid II:glycine glycyltransferase FemX [Promethearchaeota archaeon]